MAARRTSALACLVPLVCLLAHGGEVAAQEHQPRCEQNETCLGIAERAFRLSQAGQLDAALAEYRTAYGSYSDPFLLYNQGRILHRLGRYVEAINHYQLFLMADLDESLPRTKQLRTLTPTYLSEAQIARRNLLRPRTEDRALRNPLIASTGAAGQSPASSSAGTPAKPGSLLQPQTPAGQMPVPPIDPVALKQSPVFVASRPNGLDSSAKTSQPAEQLDLFYFGSDNLSANKPVYKRGWLWGVLIGAAAGTAMILGLSIGLTRSRSPSMSMEPGPEFRPFEP